MAPESAGPVSSAGERTGRETIPSVNPEGDSLSTTTTASAGGVTSVSNSTLTEETAREAADRLAALQPTPSTNRLRRAAERIAGSENGHGSGKIGLMSGPSLTMRQTLGLKQVPELRLSQVQRLELSQKLHDIEDEFGAIYAAARKRTYDKHGLKFEYAVVSRREFPYMVMIGSAGLHFNGMRFVMEDFVLDLGDEEREKFMDLIAVHEFGESLFHNHHQASLLEFRVAQLDGFLERHLELMEQKYSLKFRDVCLDRMLPELAEAFEKMGVKADLTEGEGVEQVPDSPEVADEGDAHPAASGDPMRLRAEAFRDEFQWPEKLFKRYAPAAQEDEEAVREAVDKWARYVAVTQHAIGYLNRSAQAAKKSVEKSLSKGKSMEVALHDVALAFYGTLRGLEREVRNEILNREEFAETVIAEALERLKNDLDAEFGRLIELFIPSGKAKDAAFRALEDLPLYQRDFGKHLRVVELENEWLLKFGRVKKGGEPAPDEVDEIEKKVLNRDRALLWRFVFATAEA